ncbi:TetR/AcrR family transcriptional regulator [Dietzia sp. PP-33]|jgi:AcrR family transcriptional regulator|uniref:TetR/AcrR family transcriptional regulator n=1 Tax=Dietzia sp. PP-33 TaxID=2957500 RepID=UPI0029A36706|nr:TetR/AcrR family transcriptional regulator [Dietzia sp. PP-33]MDX2355674.1 TetR/AcrR family transcriptional regulator [Dietzia sp. PP-33]
MTSPPDADSLRERKRRSTMVAIETAATSLVLEHGYDCVTVDQICSQAQVSKRTFFNYVPSKEAAVIGSPPAEVPEGHRADFLDAVDPDVPGALLRLFLGAFEAARVADDAQTAVLAHRRREIFRANPELGAARMTASYRFQIRLVDLVTEHFRRHPFLRSLDGVPAEAEARACVALVAASANLGFSTWLTREAATFDNLHVECATALRQLALLVTRPADSEPNVTEPSVTHHSEHTGTPS